MSRNLLPRSPLFCVLCQTTPLNCKYQVKYCQYQWGVGMRDVERVVREQLALLAEANMRADRAIAAILDAARGMDGGVRENAGVLLEVAEVVGRCGQARDGQLVQLLAQADRVGVPRAGLQAWVSTHLDVTRGKARAMAEAARTVGAVPELAAPLSSGEVGADTIRALTRTAQAVDGTGRETITAMAETLTIASRDGVAAANRHVRILEHTVGPGSPEEVLARQRVKSYARVSEVEGGMCRVDVLLDPVRGTTLRAAIDVLTAAWIRERQYDKADPLPVDVRSTGQINAHALVRLAEVFLTATPEQRGARLTPPTLYYLPLDPAHGDRFAESVYGTLVPRTVVAPPGHPAAHIIHVEGDHPVLLDGARIDTTPTARLATPAQRTALAFRDRHCRYPGCTRPPTWSLHAHHLVPYGKGGPTTLRNLALLCPEHHSLTHHPQHKR